MSRMRRRGERGLGNRQAPVHLQSGRARRRCDADEEKKDVGDDALQGGLLRGAWFVNRLRRHTRASQPLQRAGNVSTRREGETERC